jgi:hypothetical protein
LAEPFECLLSHCAPRDLRQLRSGKIANISGGLNRTASPGAMAQIPASKQTIPEERVSQSMFAFDPAGIRLWATSPLILRQTSIDTDLKRDRTLEWSGAATWPPIPFSEGPIRTTLNHLGPPI